MFFKDQLWSPEGGAREEISRGASSPCSSFICLFRKEREAVSIPSRWLFDGAEAKLHSRQNWFLPTSGRERKGWGARDAVPRLTPVTYFLQLVHTSGSFCQLPISGQSMDLSVISPLMRSAPVIFPGQTITELTFRRTFFGPLWPSCLS